MGMTDDPGCVSSLDGDAADTVFATLHGINTVGVLNPNPSDCSVFLNRNYAGALLDGQDPILHSFSGAQQGYFSDAAGYGCCIFGMSAISYYSDVYLRLFDYRGDLRGDFCNTLRVYESAMLQNGISSGCGTKGSSKLLFMDGSSDSDCCTGGDVDSVLSGGPGVDVFCENLSGFNGFFWTEQRGGDGINRSSLLDEEYRRFRFKSSVRDKNSVIPLPGLFKSGDFLRVYKDLGACHICGKRQVRFRCEEFKVNVCDACMVKIIRRDRVDGVNLRGK